LPYTPVHAIQLAPSRLIYVVTRITHHFPLKDPS
jgi:hypothetical protein